MQSIQNAILWVLNKKNVHKSESILQNPIRFDPEVYTDSTWFGIPWLC